MQIINFALASATLLSAASARITGFYAPSEVAAGSTVTLKIIAENYIQSEQDVAMSFGITPAANHYPDTLGTFLSSRFLGRSQSNIVGNITAEVKIPEDQTEGTSTMTGSLFALVGAVYSPTVENYVVNITVGKTTSTDYVMSKLE